MPDREMNVHVIVDQRTGEVHGTRFFVSEEHAVRDIQDRGFSYDPMQNPIMPAKIVWRSDR